MNDAFTKNLDGTRVRDEQMLRHYLAIPYVAIFYSTVNDDGDWVRRADYPELPNCEVEAPTAVEAMDKLEVLRVAIILNLLDEGRRPPAPRPPLTGGASGLSSETIASQLQHANEVIAE